MHINSCNGEALVENHQSQEMEKSLSQQILNQFKSLQSPSTSHIVSLLVSPSRKSDLAIWLNSNAIQLKSPLALNMTKLFSLMSKQRAQKYLSGNAPEAIHSCNLANPTQDSYTPSQHPFSPTQGESSSRNSTIRFKLGDFSILLT